MRVREQKLRVRDGDKLREFVGDGGKKSASAPRCTRSLPILTTVIVVVVVAIRHRVYTGRRLAGKGPAHPVHAQRIPLNRRKISPGPQRVYRAARYSGRCRVPRAARN